MRYYAVKKGRKIGIYESWSECEKQVKGFRGAIHKSFAEKADAETFIKDKAQHKKKKTSPKKTKKVSSIKLKPDSDSPFKTYKNSKSGKIYMQIGRI